MHSTLLPLALLLGSPELNSDDAPVVEQVSTKEKKGSSSKKEPKKTSSSSSKPAKKSTSSNKPAPKSTSSNKPSKSSSKPAKTSSSSPSTSNKSKTTPPQSRPVTQSPPVTRTNQARPQPDNAGTRPDHMPGSGKDPTATRPVVSGGPNTRPSTSPGNSGPDLSRPDPWSEPGVDLRPGNENTRPDAPTRRPDEVTRQPDNPYGSTRDPKPERPSVAGSYDVENSVNSSPGTKTRPESGNNGTKPGRPDASGRPDIDSPDAGWTGSQPNKRPDSNGRPDKGNNTRPDKTGSSRPDSNHARPDDSRGNAAGHHGSNNNRPDDRGNSSGHHGSSHSRPNAGRAPHHNHQRPHTPVHTWYYGGHSRPIYNSHTTRNVYWYHGVWVYGPYPTDHHHYHHGSHGSHSGGSTTTTTKEERPELPRRKIDRTDRFSLGVQGGQYLSSYDAGVGFADPGLGLSLGYRPVETVGLELSYTYFDQTFDGDTERQTSTLQPSVNLYAFPWTRVNPYLTVGGTMTRRAYDDSWTNDSGEQSATVIGTAYGPHAGLGLEIAVGDNAALDARGTYISYQNVDGSDANAPGALQGTVGLDFYF